MSKIGQRNDRRKQNREYKKEIYSLCQRTVSGDNLARQTLESEIASRPLALWAVKHWMKVRKIPVKVVIGKDKLDPKLKIERARFQRMGFEEGAAVPGSHIRKITK